MAKPLRAFALVAAAALLIAPGCGYRLAGRGEAGATPGAAIEIRTFENRSAEPGLELTIADAMVEEFARRGQLEPVYAGSSPPADWALLGVIRDVQVAPTSLSSVSLELESRIEVELEISLVRGPERALVWRHDPLVLRELFLTSADPQVRESNKEQALRSLAARLAARIHDELSQTD